MVPVLIVALCGYSHGSDEYGFDAEEFEKKSGHQGGFAEMRWQHMDVRQGSALAWLNLGEDPPATLDDLSGSLQLNGAYAQGIASLNWLLNASGTEHSSSGWQDSAEIYESFFSLSSSSTFAVSIGKKSYKWGKGYAWNPVGFINRSKDPENPEEALEGYIAADLEAIKSYSGDLRTIALTGTVLPVWQGVNEDFGAEDKVNLAAKLYLLYLDTDIDFVVYSGNSRTTRFGVDFSRNLSSSFEIHGEVAHIFNQERLLIDEQEGRFRQAGSATSFLAGIRALTNFELTSIVEYYRNGSGYTEEEMGRFYRLLDVGEEQGSPDNHDDLLWQVKQLGGQGYARPNPGRNYLYARFSQKEPFALLYFTPALTAIVNLDDHSSSLTPELAYTGITNWELRLRFSLLNGGEASEFGEKQNSNKLELRVRCFF